MSNILSALSVNNTTPGGNTTPAYQLINTAEVLRTVSAQTGWEPHRLVEQKRGRKDLGKHIVILRHPNQTGDSVAMPEIAIVNSHNGQSAFRLLIALHVHACSNGLLATSGTLGDMRVRHIGDVQSGLFNALTAMTAKLPQTLEIIKEMRGRELSYLRASAFAVEQAHLLRGCEIPTGSSILNPSFGVPVEQRSLSVWNVFNRVQAALIRGGFTYAETVPDKGLKLVRARKVSGITNSVRINTALWAAAETLLTAA